MDQVGLSSRGTCFGFEVLSTAEFDYLRTGTGPRLIVEEFHEDTPTPSSPPLIEWPVRPGNPDAARLYRDGDRYRFWISRGGWFGIDPRAPRISMPPTDEPDLRELCLWSVPAAVCSIVHGDLPLHGAAVDVDGRSIVLAAPGQAGKTTLAAAFVEAGYRLLSEDLSTLRTSSPAVLPGPAVLRLRSDVRDFFSLPGARVVREDPDRVHLSLEEDARGPGDPVPLAAIVFLRSTDADIGLVARDPLETIRDLWGLASKLPGEDFRTRTLQGVTDIAGSVGLWDLHRPVERGNLGRVVDAILDRCLR